MRCANCGRDNEVGTAFCVICGTAMSPSGEDLPASADGVVSHAEAPEAPEPQSGAGVTDQPGWEATNPPETEAFVGAPSGGVVAAAPLLPAAVPTAVSPVADRSGSARKKWIGIALGVGVVLVVLLAVGYGSRISDSRSKANDAIAAAEKLLDGVAKDAEPGTDEFKTVDSAKGALLQAKAYAAAGSWLNPGAYDKAQESAKQAAAGAGAVDQQVSGALSSAEALKDENKYDEAAKALLAFARKYPHSDQASQALSDADDSIVSATSNYDSVSALQSIARYLPLYPKGYESSALKKKGHDLLVESAKSMTTDLDIAHGVDSAWSHAMLVQGHARGDTAANFDDQSGLPSAAEARRLAGLARQLRQPQSFVTVFSLLADAAQAASDCNNVAQHPQSGWQVSGNTKSATWSKSQCQYVQSRADAMKQKIDAARKAMSAIQG